MAWFKIDDELPDHRKARAVRKSHPSKRRDVSPFGLWALAGAWSNDGFVPLEVLEDWDDDAEVMAERLVTAGLWHPTERDGEPGYVFHDWDDQNPVRGERDPSASGSFGNHVRWHEKRGEWHEDCEHCNPDRGDIGCESGATSGANPSGIGGESLPSRPDPTRPEPDPKKKPRPKAAETEMPERFEEFWETYSHKVGRKKAEAAYRLALRKPGVTAEVLIASAASYITWQMSEGKHPTYTKHAATWLNGEHWTDERAGRATPPTRVQQHLALARQLAEEESGQMIPFPQIGGPR